MAIRAVARRPGGGSGGENAPIAMAIVAWVIALTGFFRGLYLVATSLKSEAAAVLLPPTFIPLPGFNLQPTEMPPFTFSPTFEQYQTILDRGFGPFFLRSVAVVVASGLLVLLLAVPCAYALAFRLIEGWRDTILFFLATDVRPPARVHMPA